MFATTTQRAILMAALCLMGSPFAQCGKPDTQTDSNKTEDELAKHPNRVFDFKITPDMKTSDLDDPKSALSKLIAFIVKGPKPASEYVSVETKGRTHELKLEIKDDSIFVPGGKPENAQNGFRRTDVNPAIDPNKTFTGTTTFYQTIRFDPNAPLVLKHGYLLASIEIEGGNHIFDIFTGSDFDSNNVAQKESSNAHKIRVRDLTTKTLFELPLEFTTSYNFAITIDWVKNTLTVYASINQEPLKMVAGPVANDPKAMSAASAQTAEYHLQLIKFPTVDVSVPVDKRGNVPHVGLQEKIVKEHIFFSNIYVTSGDKIEQPRFGKKKSKHSRCKV